MRTPHNERLGDINAEPSTGRDRASGRGGASGGKSRKGASSEQEDGPERRCVLSGDHEQRDDLIRLAISPDGDVLPDVLARAPGRGAWIGVTRTELETAMAKGKLKGALARAFKGAALTIPANLPDMIEAALIRVINDRLGLEMRSGKLLTGSDRIAEKARAGQVKWLAHASDAASDGSRKLDQAWRVGREEEGTGLAGVTLPLDRAALSVALGRENVVHLALTESAAAKRLGVPLARLLHFLSRPDDAGDPGHGTTQPPGMIDDPGASEKTASGDVDHQKDGHASGETQRPTMTTTIQDTRAV
jgi:predicted RNA-binding protein YlxR (DUF448 family)